MRRFVVGALCCVAMIGAAGAHAQREFIEELPPKKAGSIDGVDLDAPDPATKPKDPKATDPKATTPDPKATTPDPKPTTPDPKATTPDPKVIDTPDPKATEPAADAKEGGIAILQTSYAALLEKWDHRATVARNGEVARAKKMLPEVDEALLDFGVQGVPGGFQATAVAHALLREANKALDDGSQDEAQALVDAAERAAPDLAAVYGTLARVRWAAGDLGGAANALVSAVRSLRHDPLALSQIGARAIATLSIIAVLLLIMFALLTAVPALRYVSFDIHTALPKGAHPGQVLALVVMAAIAPLMIGAGPVFGALALLTITFMYLQPRARLIVTIIGAILVALPLGLHWGGRLAAYAGSRADQAHRALFDATAEPIRTRLAQRPADQLSLVESAALAMQSKREGRIPEALERWKAVVAKHDVPFAHAGLGVVAGIMNDEQTALAELGKAISADDDLHAAKFDTFVLHFRASRSDKADAIVTAIAQTAPDELAAFRRTTYRAPDQTVGHNRSLVDVYPAPLAVFRAGLEPSVESAAVEEAAARALLRGETGTRAQIILGGFVGAWLLMFALRKKLKPAQACVRCGSPASKRVDGKDVPEDTCGQCFHAFVSTRSRIDAGVKLRKEREIIERRRRMARAIVGLSVLLPGAGHAIGEAPVRAAIFAGLYMLGLAGAALSSGLLPMPWLDGPLPSMPMMIICGAIAGITFLASLRSAWALAEDTSGRGRR